MIAERFNKESYFEQLVSSVNYCNLCGRMCGRRKVLSKNNGNINSKVLFIAEAPGRLGAECTGIPLYGDKTGDNFELLLANINWKRHDVFITNSILCNPQTIEGNNSTPIKEEIQNCNYYLDMTIELINPEVIVTLGAVALESLKYIRRHNFALSDSVAKRLSWNNRVLYPMYHMGPRALVHRSLIKQRGDFIALSHFVDPIEGIKRKSTESEKVIEDNVLLDVIKIILYRLGKVSTFKLNKLLFLIDYNYYKTFGTTITDAIYLRMQEGPWIPTLTSLLKQGNESFTSIFEKSKPYVIYNGLGQLVNNICRDKIDFINMQIDKYKDFTDGEIKTCVYLSEPMKYILIQEMKGNNMTKKPVLYKSTIINDSK